MRAKSRLSNGRYANDKQVMRERMVAPVMLILSVAFTWGVSLSPTIHQIMAADSVQANAGQIAKPNEAESAPLFIEPKETWVEEIKPPAKELSQKQEIIEYIVEVFGEDAPDAFNVLYCENRGLNTQAINENRNGTTDHSLFQINSIHTKRFGSNFMTNWKANVDVAHQIFTEQGWTPWACSHRVGVTPFWQK